MRQFGQWRALADVRCLPRVTVHASFPERGPEWLTLTATAQQELARRDDLVQRGHLRQDPGEALGMRIMANKVTQIAVPLAFGGFGAAMDGIINNQVDAAFTSSISGKAYQIAKSPRRNAARKARTTWGSKSVSAHFAITRRSRVFRRPCCLLRRS